MSPKPTPKLEQSPLPFYEAGIPQLDRYQRIEMLDKIDGFLPASRAELTEATGLQSFIGKPGGAAKHIAEVVTHQNNADTADPLAAGRRLTRDYINYTLDAHNSGLALGLLRDSLREVLNPELILDRVVEPTEPGLLPFLRFFDLSELRNTGRADKIGYDPQKVTYAPENGGIMYYLEQALASWRVHQVRRKLPAAISHESARFDFWVQRVVEISKHYPKFRPIAEDGLNKIYGRVKVQ